MATSNVKKRRKKAAAAPPLVTRQRKQEVLGVILMAIAVLVGLALLSYTPTDNGLARAFSLQGAFNPGNNRAENALGLVGAAMAYLLIPNFLGFSVLLPAGLCFAWGYTLFRNKQAVYLPFITPLLLIATFVVACLFGWFGQVLQTDLLLWSGGIGLGIATWMTRLFGTAGTFILLVVLLLITAMLVVDHDIQRTLDRFEDVVTSIRNVFRNAWRSITTRFSEWRLTRAEHRAAHRAERERARNEREQARRDRLQARAQASPRAAQQPSTAAAPRQTELPMHKPGAAGSVNDQYRPGTRPPELATPANTPEPAPSPATTAPPDPANPDDTPASLELEVLRRIEEERADSIERKAEVPVDEVPYRFPTIDLLDAKVENQPIDYDELEENKRILLDKLETYNIQITDIKAVVGPTITLYELTPAPGVKISRITALEDDLAMAMAARGIRMIAPIPGKSAIGVEIPNRHRELVRLRDLIGTTRFRDTKMELPFPIGKTIEGQVFIQDLVSMPHLLIAGATGAGKSVGLNALITGLIYACHPANLKFVMIDPKKIELQQFSRINDHMLAGPESLAYESPIITDVAYALGALKSCEKEMEVRYNLLAKAMVRGVKDYNRKLSQGSLSQKEGHRHLPYIVVVIDELADLMLTAGKEIEGPIARLAQMSRAVGIHLVLATQRPSVDVITGLIKANFPSRIAYQVASKIDSRTILDQNGAERLVGNGDLLYMKGSQLVRLQGPYVSVEEVDAITDYVGDQPGNGPYILPPFEEDETGMLDLGKGDVTDKDELFEEAARIIVRSQQGSVSLLQRKLSIGYTRSARIVDQLEEAGIVGPFEGSKARQVLVGSDEELDAFLRSESP